MDDLAPIFNAQSTILQKIYGEFYLAEMIASQNEDTQCLVAEVVIPLIALLVHIGMALVITVGSFIDIVIDT